MIRCLAVTGLTRDLKTCNPGPIETARIDLQYVRATEKCDYLGLPENWRNRLGQEYQDLIQTLQLWNKHRHSWYEGRGHNLQAKFDQLDRMQLRDTYCEIHFRLKVQRKRWQHLIQSLANPQLVSG